MSWPTLALLIALLVSAPAQVSASQVEYLNVYRITLRTDLWVRARVVESNLTNPRESIFDGPIHDLEVTLKVLDSTDPDVSGTINVVIDGTYETWTRDDGDRFLALKRKDGAFTLYSGTTYGVFPVDRGRMTGFLHMGSEVVAGATVDETFAWNRLRDTRLLVDGNGNVPAPVRAHWESVLRSGSPAEVCLALEWFDQLKAPEVDCMALARNVVRNYTELAAGVVELHRIAEAAEREAPDEFNWSVSGGVIDNGDVIEEFDLHHLPLSTEGVQELDSIESFIASEGAEISEFEESDGQIAPVDDFDYLDEAERDYINARDSLRSHFSASARVIAHEQHVEAARMLEELYWRDQRTHNVLGDVGIIPLLAVPATPEQLDRLKSLLGQKLTLSSGAVRVLGRIPDPAINPFLWDIARMPRPDDYMNSVAEAVWEALVLREDPGIRDYFNTHILKSGRFDDEAPKSDFNSGTGRMAWGYYLTLPRTEPERKEDLGRLVKLHLEEDYGTERTLSRLLRPGDTQFAPLLATVQIKARWARPSFIERIVLRIPDPAFVPLLKSWGEEDPANEVIQGLLACGAEEDALALAEARMAKAPDAGLVPPLGEEDLEALFEALAQRAGLLSVLAETEYKDRVAAWVESDFSMADLRRYERLFLAESEEMFRELTRFHLHELFGHVALAITKSDKDRALPWLQHYYETGPYARIQAALCLYALDNELEKEPIEAFRKHRDQDYYLMCDHYFPLVFQLNDRGLNSLVQEHFTSDLGRDPWWTRDESVLSHLGEPFLTYLFNAVESDNILHRSGAVQAIEEILGRKFGYDEAQPRLWNDVAAEKYANALRKHIERTRLR